MTPWPTNIHIDFICRNQFTWTPLDFQTSWQLKIQNGWLKSVLRSTGIQSARSVSKGANHKRAEVKLLPVWLHVLQLNRKLYAAPPYSHCLLLSPKTLHDFHSTFKELVCALPQTAFNGKAKETQSFNYMLSTRTWNVLSVCLCFKFIFHFSICSAGRSCNLIR